MSETMPRWAVPALTTRAQLVAEAFALAVGLVVFAIIAVAAPWLRWWFAVPVIVVLVYLFVVLVTQRTWVDGAAVTRRRWLLRPASVPLGPPTSVEITARGAGSAALTLRAGRTVRIPLISVTLFASRGQSTAVLHRLADAVAPLDGGPDVAGRLRAQATHVEHGGGVEDSPLVARPAR